MTVCTHLPDSQVALYPSIRTYEKNCFKPCSFLADRDGLYACRTPSRGFESNLAMYTLRDRDEVFLRLGMLALLRDKQVCPPAMDSRNVTEKS